jgi:hypothetical protein
MDHQAAAWKAEYTATAGVVEYGCPPTAYRAL